MSRCEQRLAAIFVDPYRSIVGDVVVQNVADRSGEVDVAFAFGAVFEVGISRRSVFKLEMRAVAIPTVITEIQRVDVTGSGTAGREQQPDDALDIAVLVLAEPRENLVGRLGVEYFVAYLVVLVEVRDNEYSWRPGRTTSRDSQYLMNVRVIFCWVSSLFGLSFSTRSEAVSRRQTRYSARSFPVSAFMFVMSLTSSHHCWKKLASDDRCPRSVAGFNFRVSKYFATALAGEIGSSDGPSWSAIRSAIVFATSSSRSAASCRG
ncbi:hypothetical protein ACLI4Y_13195 [Natrialbaceae archaeon A-CW3]